MSSLSPTSASTMLVSLEEVLKLLVDLLPVVEGMAEYNPDYVGYRCFYCNAFSNDGNIPIQHLDVCEKELAKNILPRLRKMIEKLQKQS